MSAPATESRYEQRGVSSDKREVHAAIAKLDKGLFPGAFCKILPDVLGDPPDPRYVNISHPDGAGTKAIVAYLVWKLQKDLKAVRRIARCSLTANLDDAGCVGTTGPFLITQTLNRNAARITGEVVQQVIEGCQEFCDLLTKWGAPCVFASGETADVADAVRTWLVDNNLTARFRKENVIDASEMAPGQLLVGFSSIGQALWEEEENSGIGCNGHTNARHDTLSLNYRLYTETFSPETEPDLIYNGAYRLDEPLPTDRRFTIASALLSPTRTYLPLLKQIFEKIGRRFIAGLIHCSGGGQAKIRKFGRTRNLYLKDKMFPVPPLFSFLQAAGGLSWEDVLKNYCVGHRLEAAVPDQTVADECIAISKECGIEAQVIGEIRENPDGVQRKVLIIIPGLGEFPYLDD